MSAALHAARSPEGAKGGLRDNLGRYIHYLRLSVTDRCNFRCVYCLPQGCPRGSTSQPLSIAEIDRLVRAFAGLGFWKVRLTGGEPTMRRDLCEIVARIAATPGIRRIGLTTNGYRLAAIAADLRDAGLSSVNVSLDSLDPARFEQLTGCPRLESVIAGVEAAISAGIPSVKINAVLLRGMDDCELDRFLSWTTRFPIAVRFIELMQTAENGAFFRQHHLSADSVRQKLEARGWAKLERDASDGPASYYGRPNHAGKVGLIAPYSAHFCSTCNRVRVSSTGDLRPCLFGDDEFPLRTLLEREEDREALMRVVERSIKAKPASHLLQLGRCGAATNLAATGG